MRRRPPFVTQAVLAVASLAAACSGAATPAKHARTVHPAPSRPSRLSARKAITRYLSASFGGNHGVAWALLTAHDRAVHARDAYVAEQQANDRLRAQVGALGSTTYKLVSLNDAGDRATAIVEVRSGLGVQKLRFSLRLEGGTWGIVYDTSWVEVGR